MTKGAIKVVDVLCPSCQSNDNEPFACGIDFEYKTSKQEYSILKCNNCDVLYLSPRPDITELEKIYPPEYNPFNFHKIKNPIVRYGRNYVQKRKVRFLKKILPVKALIIDVGCGSGSLLIMMQKCGHKEWSLYGNDFNKEALSILESNGIKTFSGRFEAIVTDTRFDSIVLNQTFEHLDCPAEVLKKAYCLLKPGGLLIMETPSIEGLDAKNFKNRYWGGYHIPRHWTFFSSKSITDLLERNGYVQIKISYLASPSFWIQSLHHYFSEKRCPEWWVNLFVFKNPLLLAFFTIIDSIAIFFGLPTSNMRIVAKRANVPD